MNYFNKTSLAVGMLISVHATHAADEMGALLGDKCLQQSLLTRVYEGARASELTVAEPTNRHHVSCLNSLDGKILELNAPLTEWETKHAGKRLAQLMYYANNSYSIDPQPTDAEINQALKDSLSNPTVQQRPYLFWNRVLIQNTRISLFKDAFMMPGVFVPLLWELEAVRYLIQNNVAAGNIPLITETLFDFCDSPVVYRMAETFYVLANYLLAQGGTLEAPNENGLTPFLVVGAKFFEYHKKTKMSTGFDNTLDRSNLDRCFNMLCVLRYLGADHKAQGTGINAHYSFYANLSDERLERLYWQEQDQLRGVREALDGIVPMSR